MKHFSKLPAFLFCLAAALTLVLFLTPAASASVTDDALISIEVTQPTFDTLSASIRIKNGAGLKADTLIIGYNSSVLKYKNRTIGKDADLINRLEDNSFTSEINPQYDVSSMICSYYFYDDLYDTETFRECCDDSNAKKQYNGEDFELLVINFSIIGSSSEPLEFTLTSDNYQTSGTLFTPVTECPHTYTTTPAAVKATTARAGKTGGLLCADCGKVLKKQTTVARIASSAIGTTTYTYTGKVKSPSVTVKDTNGKKLSKGTDYAVSYKNNVKPGKASAVITFKGKYSGKITLSFTIKPAAVTGLKKTTKSGYAFVLKWNAVSYADRYQVQAFKDGKWKTMKTVSATQLSYKTQPSGTIKWRVRAGTTSGSSTIYGAYSDALFACRHTSTTTIAKVPATLSANGKTAGRKCAECGKTLTSPSVIPKISSVKLSYSSRAYTGKSGAPTVTVKDSKGKKLLKGTDYTVSVSNSTEIGSGSVKVTFKGKYKGTKTLKFEITPRKVANLHEIRNADYAAAVQWDKTSQADEYEISAYIGGKWKISGTTQSTSVGLGRTGSTNLSGMKIRVRAIKTVNGKKYKGPYSEILTLK